MNRFILYMIKYKLVYGTICKNTSKHAKSYSIRKLHKNVIILKVQLFFYDKYPIVYHPPPKYKKYLIWPIKYSKHYKSSEYMKRTILSINMIGNEKQKTWPKNTIFTSKMLKVLCPC